MTKRKIKKTINLKKESIELIDESTKDFENIFGRKPTDNDPVFLDQIFYNASELHQSMINVFSEDLNLEPSNIYAFDKLGYLVSDSNYEEWTDQEIKAWEDAVEEGEKIKNGEIILEKSDIEKNVIAISNNIPQLVCLFSLLNWKINCENKGVNLYEKVNLHDYSIFCLKKTLKSLKACLHLIENDFIADALIIVRSLFEIYLQLSFSNNSPDKLLQELKCKIGLHDKTHKRIKNKIQEIETGIEFTPLNNREKSSLNKKFQNEDSHLYFLIYEDFSSLSHPDLRSAHYYFQNDHDIHYTSNLDQLANFYCSVISVMILFELYKLDLFIEPFQNDIKYHIQLVGETIKEFFKLSDEASSGELIYVKKRIEKTLNEIK